LNTFELTSHNTVIPTSVLLILTHYTVGFLIYTHIW